MDNFFLLNSYKTCLLLTESNHIFQLKNFSKSNINKIEENWNKITETIFKAISFLQEFGYTNRLSSGYILSVIAYFIFRTDQITQNDKNEMLRFVRNAQITSYFTTSLDSKLEVVAKIIRNSTTFAEINVQLAESKTRPLKIFGDDVERMPDMQYGHPAILPILQLLYPNLDFKNSTFHIDHIFPKSKFNKKNKDLPEDYIGKQNFLFNLQLLQGEENLSKRAKDPEIWLNENYNDIDQISAYKERNYIPKDFQLDWVNMAEFEEKRINEIKSQLKKIFEVEMENASA